LTSFVDELADAAIAAVSGNPGAGRAPRRRPREGRVRVQLLTSDGVVTAEGEAVAELVPVRSATT
jgi:hypothetical protein